MVGLTQNRVSWRQLTMQEPARQSALGRQQAPPKPPDSVSANVSERGPRERLLDAINELCAMSGYRGVSIAEVCSQAGVSTATFYEHFDAKEDCLLASYRAIAEGLIEPMRPGPPDDGNPSRVTRAVI